MIIIYENIKKNLLMLVSAIIFLDQIKTLQTTKTHKSNGMRLSASPLQIR